MKFSHFAHPYVRSLLQIFETLLLIFQIHSQSENARKANEIYDANKEGENMRILGHLMRVPASSYFFTLNFNTNCFFPITIASY
jgi:hypothetical protein